MLALHRSQLDITEDDSVRRIVARHRPDWVINAAAYNKVDLAESEPEAAMRVNAFAVRAVATACAEAGATLLHYSTDHVFDGSKGTPYLEQDLPAPQSVYGVSKLAGELFARACCRSHYVLRVGGVFGPPGRYTNHGNFPEFVLRKCAEGTPLRIVDDQFATPTFGTALAGRSLDVLEKQVPFGLYHLGRERGNLVVRLRTTDRECFPLPRRDCADQSRILLNTRSKAPVLGALKRED